MFRALSLKACSKGSSEIPQSWCQVITGCVFKTILRIYWKSFLVYLENQEATKLSLGFEEPVGLLESPEKTQNSVVSFFPL